MAAPLRHALIPLVLVCASVGGCKSGGPQCGNGVVDTGEECDPGAPLGPSCTDRGFTGGPIFCDPATCTVDDAFCYDCASAPTTCPDAWLAAHNGVRSNLNAGAISGQPAPSSPIPLLAWDDALATVAAQYAAQCIWDHNAARSDDYAAAGGSGYVGENLFLVAGFEPTPDDAVSDWASEAADYDYATNSCAPMKACGHYTQLVWASTTAVGCAAAPCASVDVAGKVVTNAWLVVCDYAPGGNYVGELPY